MKKIIKDFAKKYWKIVLVLTILNIFMIHYTSLKNDIYHDKFLILVIAFFTLFELGLVSLYALFKEKKWKIEKLFLLICLPIGLLHVFITPFNQVPDEIVHIFRVDAISDGKIIAQEDESGAYKEKISKTFWEVLNNSGPDKLYYKKVKDMMFAETSTEEWPWSYGGAAFYNPIAYAPQVVGVSLGKTLRLPVVLTMYLGRLFVLIATVIIGYFALKIMPKYKEFLLLILLIPMTIQQSSVYSGDSMLMSSAFLLIACAFKYIYGGDKKLSKKQIFSIFATTILVACCKSIIYLPIAFLFFLVPREKFKKPFYKYMVVVGAMIVAAFLSLGWSLKLANLGSSAQVVETTNVNFQYVTHRPIEFGTTVVGTALDRSPVAFISQIFGQKLSYYNYDASEIYTVIFVVLAVLLLYRNIEKIKMKSIERFLYWGIPIAVVCAIFTATFIQWDISKPEDYMISGVQGRYFTPLLPLIPFMIYPLKPEKRNPISVDYVFMFGVFANSCILACKFLYNF